MRRARTALDAEWRTLGRSSDARAALAALAARDPRFGEGDLYDLMARMRGSTATEGAALISSMLANSDAHPLVARCILQALIPGLTGVGRRLRWGAGGAWPDREAFGDEMFATAWEVIVEWAGVDRPYAVLDLLSATRCRLLRWMIKEEGMQKRAIPLDGRDERPVLPGLDAVEAVLSEAVDAGVKGAETVYAVHVLGYSYSEIAEITGVDRRTVYARRDRTLARLAATS